MSYGRLELMVVLRCTQKLLVRLKQVGDLPPVESTTRLGDWYGNILWIGRCQHLLFISERSRLPVLIPIREAKPLSTVLPDAVCERLVIVGEPRQIRLAGSGWLKSVHGAGAAFMSADPELIADTRSIQRGLGLDIIANDYILSDSGPYLLEVNHIPSVTCFPELWEDYLGVVETWVAKGKTKQEP